MTPFDAFALGRPLVLDHPIGGKRLIAAIWPDGDGIGFADVADIGWPLNDSGHPFHQAPGPIVGDGPYWRIGPIALRELESWDPLNAAWEIWQEWTAAHPEITPALARSAAQSG